MENYRGAACKSCNVKEGKITKIIPVFFHNGSNYDFHFIVAELKKYENKYNKLEPLAKSSEEYISMDFGNFYRKLRFLDSYRFTLASLDNLVKSLDEEDLTITKKNFNFPIDLKKKGVYPYDYIDSIERLKETELPPKEKFYSILYQKHISDEEYERAKDVWQKCKCKTFQDYHDIYLKLDVLLLADCFEKYRSVFIQ